MRKIINFATVAMLLITSLFSFSINENAVNASENTEQAIEGDINNDGVVDFKDISILQNWLLRLETMTEQQAESADTVKDDRIDVFDMVYLKQIVLEKQDNYIGFIKTEGQLLKDEKGKSYFIKGISFGNNVWANPDMAPLNLHHTEESFKELSDAGFNSVRFYLNYGLFEDDSNPYTYKESGFEWLNTNIAWAKKYGIKLILNMHYPQGGFQSQGNGTELWTVPENQERLSALWKEIASRYSKETTILGYGLVNEPVVAVSNAQNPLLLWRDLAQKITNDIRNVDSNHIIFMESMSASQNIETKAINWNIVNDDCNFMKLNDDNTVYEFHFYSPHEFTHQGFDWANTLNYDEVYPNEEKIIADGAAWYAGTFGGDKMNVNDTEWAYLESNFITATEDNQLLSFVFQAQNIGENGVAYADDIKLDEYDPDGNYVRTVYSNSFDEKTSADFWAANNIGSGGYCYTEGKTNIGSLKINNTTDDANIKIGYFNPQIGYQYKASGYFKAENAVSSAVIRPRVDIWKVDNVYVWNHNFLEQKILQYAEFSKNNNVPIYCGEFGSGSVSFQNNRGGERWVSDMIDIFISNNISFNYHTYHESAFGLYQNDPLSPPSNRNDVLYQLFCNKLT